MLTLNIKIVLAFISLYRLLGWSAFVGVAIMTFSIPLNAYIARVLKKMQQTQMKNRDKRTKMMNELLNNIKRSALFAFYTEKIVEGSDGMFQSQSPVLNFMLGKMHFLDAS